MRGRASNQADKDPFAVSLGRRIKARREALGITQRELSRRAKYDAVQLSRLESGEAIPRADALLRIAAALETPIGQLYGLPDGVSMLPADAAETAAPSLAAEQARLLAKGGLALVEELREIRAAKPPARRGAPKAS